MKELVITQLKARGVGLEDIAEVVFDLGQTISKKPTMQMCLESVEAVLDKREAQYTILTGIAIDTLAERDLIFEPLGEAIKRDESLYGVDEILALGITNIYGSMGLTRFGYLDKRKSGIIGKLNADQAHQVNTFLDDLVAGIASAAFARLTHQLKAVQETWVQLPEDLPGEAS